MLNTINLLRVGVQCCRKCRSLTRRVSTTAVFDKPKDTLSVEKLKFLESERKKYENTFGDIDSFERKFERIQDDPEDIAEYEREKQALGKSIGEYKAEISDLLAKHKYKEAIRVLEVDMVNDKISYDLKITGIFRMLFNYTAKKGDLEEAYRLYIRFRERRGRMTAPMYTALFNACANCKNSSLALKRAEKLRENLANDNFHRVNILNYNSMLKAFGRHGDIPTCLKIFDEVLEKKVKAFTYTYNFLLQSCISDKNAGLRHALMVWKKMTQNKIKPDIFFFNLFLRCVRDCSLGDVALIPDMIEKLNQESGKFFKRKLVKKKVGNKVVMQVKKVPSSATNFLEYIGEKQTAPMGESKIPGSDKIIDLGEASPITAKEESLLSSVVSVENSELRTGEGRETNEFVKLELLNDGEGKEKEEGFSDAEKNVVVLESSADDREKVVRDDFVFPNLLSLKPASVSAVDFNSMTEPHFRIMLFGGVTGFLETMTKFKVQPNILTISLLLGVSPPTEEAEQKILKLAKVYKIQLDAPFFSQLLRKRIYSNRSVLIKDTLTEMTKANVHPDLVFFGVLAFGCDTREKGMELLETLKTYGYRANSEILYGLLYMADRAKDFVFVKAILDRAKTDGVELSSKFVAKLGRVVRSEAQERLKSSRQILEN